MITRHPQKFAEALRSLPAKSFGPATAKSMLMVMPDRFRVEPESRVDNDYLDLERPADEQRAAAQAEELARLVESLGVAVQRFAGRPDQPDGVFPNNAFATIPGRVVVGRMRHASRQLETAREDIRGWFTRSLAYDLVDLSREDCVAEMTGPLVIDRVRGVGFCGMSQRVDEAGLNAMHEALGLRLTFSFPLERGEYHTNVLLSVLAGRACVLCAGALGGGEVVETIAAAFPDRVLFLSESEKQNFVGNCLAVTPNDLLLSRRARKALSDQHARKLEDWGFRLHSCDLNELEMAGGSLRCMLAEVF